MKESKSLKSLCLGGVWGALLCRRARWLLTLAPADNTGYFRDAGATALADGVGNSRALTALDLTSESWSNR